MKKLLMVILLLVGVALAGGGYYVFYYKPAEDAAKQAALNAVPTIVPVETTLTPPTPEPIIEPTDYYVSPAKLNVHEAPSKSAFIETQLYRGDKVNVLEKQNGWARISPYYTYKEGESEVGEWIPMDVLLEVPPTITHEEHVKTISSYVEGSDDFKQHFDVFIQTTDELIQEGICLPPDFEELKGWVRSLRYEQDVYFVYCGGLAQANKIYLNVQTETIFYQ
ncbi:SH3 domain-containing protein [Vibrio renipiscarius]|uniref:SH3 domain-containing protein n=1 Tax=Vibrio renipiscarius TaxID=1461322 RepID=UPI00354E9CDF